MQSETKVYKLFFNGPIITMNEKEPRIEAVGILNEKIISTGKLNTVKKMLGQDYISVDLEGNSLLPGFIDCHLHPLLFVFYQVSLNVSEVTSLSELKEV